MRRSGVEGAAQLRALDGELDGRDGILPREPAHPLASIAQAAAKAKAEETQQPWQSTAVGGENHTEAQLHDARRQGGGGCLPGLAGLCKKAGAGVGGLGEQLVAAVAKVVDSRCGDDHWGRRSERSKDA